MGLFDKLFSKKEKDMNIQIFGTKKSSDTKKAEPYHGL